MKEELFEKISINSIDDLPKAGLYFCAITDECFGCFHFNPDDKDDIDFWIGNVMWYLQPIEPVEAEKEPKRFTATHIKNIFLAGYMSCQGGRSLKDAKKWFANTYLKGNEFEAEKELRDELIKFWEWVNDGEISNYATRLQLIDEYLKRITL